MLCRESTKLDVGRMPHRMPEASPLYDAGLVLAVERRKTGAEVHDINNLLEEYQNPRWRLPRLLPGVSQHE